jgi:hypothetical protein
MSKDKAKPDMAAATVARIAAEKQAALDFKVTVKIRRIDLADLIEWCQLRANRFREDDPEGPESAAPEKMVRLLQRAMKRSFKPTLRRVGSR